MGLVEKLTLGEQEQEVLAAGYLWMMNADIETNGPPGRVRVRDKFREEMREAGQRSHASSGPLVVEGVEGLEDLAANATDTARCLTILVELCAAEPFADLDHATDRGASERAISTVAIAMAGDVNEDDVEAAYELLVEGQKASESNGMRWLLIGLGGVAGVATAGLAAPAIGLAIGGAMGLSGAAATAAGLAWLGGGAVASGGLGMAGGTAVIAAAGALAGTGAGEVASSFFKSGRADSEAIKLFALCKLLREHAARGRPDSDRVGEFADEVEVPMSRSIRDLERNADGAENGGDHEYAQELRAASRTLKRLVTKLEERN